MLNGRLDILFHKMLVIWY